VLSPPASTTMFIFVLFSLIELSCFGLIKHNAMLLF